MKVLAALTTIFLSLSAAHSAEPSFQTIEGAGGVPLVTVEWGNTEGPGILFIHGFQQSYISWKRQLDSDLGDDFHMVAFDLRGHGGSGKPWEVDQYADTKKWADDIAAVMAATDLEQPVVVAWSYGGVVIGDYVRHYGTESLRGINFVGTDGRFIERPPLDPDIQKQRQERGALTISSNTEENLIAARAMVDFLTAETFPPEWRETVLTYNMGVPVYALKALRQRPIDNSDVVDQVNVPILISWGSEDEVMSEEMAQSLAAAFKDSRLSRYDGLGHSPFYEDAARFNRELADFAQSLN